MEKNIEKEYKFEIDKAKYFKIVEYLKSNNYIYEGYNFEQTIRFDTRDEAYAKKGIYFRAKSGFKNTFGYKSKNISNNECNQYEECEIEINSLEKLTLILKNLHIIPIRRLEKYRMKWRKNNIIVTIDELPYGLFVEIEGELSQIKITSELMGFSISNSINKTYWELSNCKNNVVFPDEYQRGLG